MKLDLFYEINLSIYFAMHSMIINCYQESKISIPAFPGDEATEIARRDVELISDNFDTAAIISRRLSRPRGLGGFCPRGVFAREVAFGFFLRGALVREACSRVNKIVASL